MKRIDWDALAPLGLGGRRTAMQICLGLGASSGFAWIFYWSSENKYRRQLYKRYFSKWGSAVPEFKPGAVMAPFYQVLDNSLLCFGLLALCMIPLAAWHYWYHYQGSRSIYLMRRLPDRRELLRRCLALPLLGVAACAVCSAVQLLIFYAVYIYSTPPQYLQPGQWRMLWENLFY